MNVSRAIARIEIRLFHRRMMYAVKIIRSRGVPFDMPRSAVEQAESLGHVRACDALLKRFKKIKNSKTFLRF